MERFNRTVRHEWLDQHLFDSVEHAQQTATQWLWRYNTDRPNWIIIRLGLQVALMVRKDCSRTVEDKSARFP